MKKFYLLVMALTITSLGFGQTTADAWINEIHYDNNGTDSNESVEIVVKNIATYPLSGWNVVLYNGNGGTSYGSVLNYGNPDSQSSNNGFTIAAVNTPQDGIQNGAPDGLALYYDDGTTNVLVQFLSYEGTLTATNGVANGQLSVDIGVSETSSTPIGQSLQLSGTGEEYSDFTWQSPATHTRGLVNNGQSLGTPSCTTYTLPFNENFDTTVPPTCWVQYAGTNGLGTVQEWTSNGDSHAGAGAAYIQWESVVGGSAEDWLVTPAIDLTGTNNELSFWTKDGFDTDEGSNYAIKVSTTSQTDHAAFTDVATYDETQLGNTYNQKTVDLTAYSGQVVYVAFVMTNNDGDAWFVDDVSIYDSTPCAVPTVQASAFSATAIDASTGTATLNWTRGNGDNVLVVMRADSAVNTDPTTGSTYTADAAFGSGDVLGTGNFVVYNGSATSVNISNLVANTTYHVAIYEYRSPDCYNTDELTGNFTVTCETYTLPFSEGFEGASTIPACWATFRGTNDLGPTNDWTIDTDANSGTNAAYVEFEAVTGNDPAEDWMVTPAITIPADANAQLTFYTKDEFSSEYGSTYTIRVSTTSQTDHGSFTIVETYDETQLGNAYNQKTIDLSAYNDTTVYIAFVMTQDDGDSWFVDDVAVDAVVVEPEAVWIEPFTDNTQYSVTLGAEGNDGSSDYFNITDGTNINKTYTGNTDNFFAAQDIDDTGWTGSASPSQLSWLGIDISGYTALSFTGLFASTATTAIDDSDYILMEYQIDGGGWTNLIAFENDGNTFNTFFLEDTNFDGEGDGIQLTSVFQSFTKSINDIGSTLDLRITIGLDSGDEDIALEDFSLTGTAPTSTDYVYDNGWTPEDPSGIATNNDNIQVLAGTTSFTVPTVANNLTIAAGTTLNIPADATFTAAGTITNEGTLALQSTSTTYSSLIADAITGSGSISYNRHVNTGAVAGEGGNDLISAPVVGQSFGDFAAANGNIITDPNDATRKLFGPFNKTTGAFEIYETDTNAATLMASAIGYRAGATDTNGFTFTGTVNMTAVNTPITYAGAGIPYRKWNLVGNPYPSYIKLSDVLAANGSQFDSNSYGVYGYDDSANNYVIWNEAYALANPDALIAPGQGFFVAANTAGGTMAFTPSMRSVGNSDDFIANRSTAVAYLKLNAVMGTHTYSTDFYFLESATAALDPGYDASVFGNNAPSEALYSQLVQGNTGIDMAIQSLALTDLGTDIAIPLGINAGAGQLVTVSIANTTLPQDIDVYLEDTANNSFTLLNTSDFTMTATTALTDTGRFYLRFVNTTLSTPDNALDALHIFATASPKVLNIHGSLQSETTLKLYDIQGRMVLSATLDSTTNTNQIALDGLSDGVYVVQLGNATQQKTQKIIVR